MTKEDKMPDNCYGCPIMMFKKKTFERCHDCENYEPDSEEDDYGETEEAERLPDRNQRSSQ